MEVLGENEAATLAQHVAAVVAMLEHSDGGVREAAVATLGKLEAATLAQHVAAVVAMLKDSDGGVRRAAVETLGKLDAEQLVALGSTSMVRTHSIPFLTQAAARVAKPFVPNPFI